MKILVVHHEMAICRRLVTVLERDGHQVLTAASGAEAASRFDRNQPDLVLLDVTLADMDGYRCARNLNTLAGDRFVPVMLMTAVSDHDSLDRQPGCRAIISSVLTLVRGLDLRVIAEGIETESQLSFLRELGCDEGQGFLMGRPMSTDALIRIAAESGGCG